MNEIQFANTDLLNAKIKESGVMIKKIAQELGLSRQGFAKKRDGQTPFRKSEVYVLCDLLNITLPEREKIFQERD